MKYAVLLLVLLFVYLLFEDTLYEMSPIGLEFHAGNGTVCLIGEYD